MRQHNMTTAITTVKMGSRLLCKEDSSPLLTPGTSDVVHTKLGTCVNDMATKSDVLQLAIVVGCYDRVTDS